MVGVDVPREREVALAVPGSTLLLEARFQPGSAGSSVIAPPHPLLGGSLDSPVVNEIAFGLHRAGVASLRFNWRGVGASSGHATDDAEAAFADFSAALSWIEASCDGPLTLAGYSFGAVTAIRVALSNVACARLVLVAPPVAMLEDIDLGELSRPVTVIVGDADDLAPTAALARQVQRIPRARLEVVRDDNHFFSRGRLAEVSELVRLALLDDATSIELDS